VVEKSSRCVAFLGAYAILIVELLYVVAQVLLVFHAAERACTAEQAVSGGMAEAEWSIAAVLKSGNRFKRPLADQEVSPTKRTIAMLRHVP
jgi:hypothetical protein